ncbi:sensory histidine-kinase / response regulator (plasmid) [Legionella adelaidensis]|uniref:Sensory histidine-kinase / response regulator n=1 Tax=Legionella adelaidensis TaxID=45056 RepID=A0A0W0R207_9GAMM|nr:Hpt domain-containing protein [Legionella adelaidensis]KTC65053.1 sensory histidine-kinase / response regulator [Legionella adelaidensis]VEH85428.1 sensory histidine-kinase / response regulator [Legionella adelaidensis]
MSNSSANEVNQKGEPLDENSGYLKDLPQNEENLFQLDDFKLFDVDEAISLNASKDSLYTVLKMMIDESLLNSDVEKMKAAYEKGDWESVQKLAHKIKGGAVYIGATRMKMACQYLERYWKVGKRTLLEKLYQQTLLVIDETLKAISIWLTKEAR